MRRSFLLLLILSTLTACEEKIAILDTNTNAPGNSDNTPDTPNIPNTPSNNAPKINGLTTQNGVENSPFNFTVSGSDLDSDTLTFSCTGCPGSASFNTSTGDFSWTPNYSDAGLYNWTFSVSDGTTSANLGVSSTVANTNRLPTIGVNTTQNGSENSLLSFDLSGSDLDNESLTYSCQNCPAGASLNASTGIVNWTPGYSDEGIYDVTFDVSDGIDTTNEIVNMTITNTNRAPVIDTIPSESINEGDTLNITPTHSDPDGDSVTLTITSTLPSNASFDGTTLIFTPDYLQAGAYQFDFQTDDGEFTASQSLSVSVNNTNQPPTLDAIGTQNHNEGTGILINLNASDPELETITYSIVSHDIPSSFSINSVTGTFQWTPKACGEDTGSYTATFRASDGDLNDDETVSFNISTITCVAWDDPSTATHFNPTSSSLEVFLGWAVDPEADPVLYEYFSEYGNAASVATWNPSFNDVTRRIELSGIAAAVGEIHYFLVSAYENDANDTQQFRWISVEYFGGSVWGVTSIDQNRDMTPPVDASVGPY